VRLCLRMSDCVVKYSVLASTDSAIIVEVLHTKLLKKHKYVLSFDDFTGEFYYVQNHPEKSWLTLEVAAQSITCRDRRLSATKQRRIAKYARNLVLNSITPSTIQFASRQISAKALRGFAVEGTLSVRGTERPLKMNVIFAVPSVDQLEIEGDFIFRFSEFGIKTPSLFFGMIKIDNQALVQFHMHAARTNKETDEAAASS
jgi:polyisoprenoid-binding protein YceI